MKKALIITGGYLNIQNISLSASDYFLIIAADSGYSSAKKLNIKPDIVLGDFDSLTEEIPSRIDTIIAPAEKDETDTALACNIAIERGADEILILGGTGGRADHFIANLFFLENLCDRGITAAISDGDNMLRILQNETVDIPRSNNYFSLFALDKCNLTLSGCKYPLLDYHLERSNTLAVSNEVTSDLATVKVNGKAILCISKK